MMGHLVTGIRKPDTPWTRVREQGIELQPYEFCRVLNAPDEIDWYLCFPCGQIGAISEDIHTVTEHEDGTISFSPSLLIYDGAGEIWHGYLERSIWRSC